MPVIRGEEVTTEEIAESIVRHMETAGIEMLEKNFISNNKIVCSVFCIVGPDAEEMTAIIRKWIIGKGYKYAYSNGKE